MGGTLVLFYTENGVLTGMGRLAFIRDTNIQYTSNCESKNFFGKKIYWRWPALRILYLDIHSVYRRKIKIVLIRVATYLLR